MIENMAKKAKKITNYPFEYDYFFKALLYCMEKRGKRGSQVFISTSTDIAEATISAIVNLKRLATFEHQVGIAKALEYEYLAFMQLGRDLANGKKPIEQQPQPDKTSETLVKAAEAFCTVLMEEEKKKTNKEG